MNKSQLLAKAKLILNEFTIGHVFNNYSNEYLFLFRLFQGHPEYMIKVGSGITGISIGIGGEYKTRCFKVHRVDGSSTDISYIQSVNGASTKMSNIKLACRSAVDPVIQSFKRSVNYGIDFCPITGVVLTKDNSHIDHYDLTFDEVFKLWIGAFNIDQLAAHLNDASADNVTKICFTSDIIINSFTLFHNANTHLRAVTKTANLSTLRKGRK